MSKLNIALIAGGNSSEREIALKSAEQISLALDKTKYNVTIVDLHGRKMTYNSPCGKSYDVDLNDFSLTVEGEKTIFEYALIIIHGTPGEDGKLQGYLDLMGIPYSSCSQVSSTITFDKISTKRAVANYGINLAKEIILCSGDSINPKKIVEELGLPLFIKPNASGSSFGITRVEREEQIYEAVRLAFTESSEVLVEECIKGREMACGVMIANGKEYVFPVTEIVPKNAFFDFESKYTAGMAQEITPADITEEVKEKLRRMTLAAYRACRCRGVVRVDFIVTPQGKPYMIEVNSIPGMSSGSIVPKQVREVGMTLGELYDIIIEDTLSK